MKAAQMPEATGAPLDSAPGFCGPLASRFRSKPLLVAPSILSADFARLGAECEAALAAGGDLLHIDVMDGHFVPNLSMGPAICAAVHKAVPGAALDVHLMVTDPAHFVEPFAKAGASHITFHVEAVGDPKPLIDRIHALGMSAGLAICPDTPASRIVPWIDSIELALVMSVHPGFSGQSFIPSVLPKTRELRERGGARLRVQMDGGVAPDSAPACRAHGCDVIVAASAIFGRRDYGAAIAALRA